MRLPRSFAVLVAGFAVAGAMLFLVDRFRAPAREPLPAPEQAGELVVLVHPGPASHFFGPSGEPTGFDVDIARLFARSKGLPVRFEIAESAGQAIADTAAGRAHIGAGGLFRPRTATGIAAVPQRLRETAAARGLTPAGVLWTAGYYPVEAVLVYNLEGYKPADWNDLKSETVAFVEHTGLDAEIDALRAAHPEVRWAPSTLPSTDALIAQVSDGRQSYALAASHVAAVARNIFLGFDVAFVAGGKRELGWVVPARLSALKDEIDAFFAQRTRDGTLQRLADRYFTHVRQVHRIDAGVFHERLRTLLPDYRPLFQRAQAATGIEWRLLAALAYQESQWDPLATSETGVRGLMQLTEDTARRLGVGDRLDPRQSVEGAARYLAELKRGLPARIQEPDRSWLALAAFNIGLGHLEDARVLAQRQKLNPDLWSDLKKTLPLLALPEYYAEAKNGYARGGMPVVFVDRVRAYYDILLAREAGYVPQLRVSVPSIGGGGPAPLPAMP
ncbi:MAG: membrane-bound lytic murein transglycosylase MltF [Betaproteobacteria bacterium]|nr:membrane-bound lytic murein transglycosylase MltF [Betaproteobacteria bacterium]